VLVVRVLDLYCGMGGLSLGFALAPCWGTAVTPHIASPHYYPTLNV